MKASQTYLIKKFQDLSQNLKKLMKERKKLFQRRKWNHFRKQKNPKNNPINEVLIVVPHIQRSFKQCTKIFVEKIVFSLFSFSFIHKKTRKMQLTFFVLLLFMFLILYFCNFDFSSTFFLFSVQTTLMGLFHIYPYTIFLYTQTIFSLLSFIAILIWSFKCCFSISSGLKVCKSDEIVTI